MNRFNVLIIEDDPDGCRSVTEAVEDLGCRVTAAMTAGKGMQAFEGGGFDLVLTDLVLPDFDGMEVLRRVRAQAPAVPVIMMTAYGTVSSAVEALKQGAYDYITKPLDLDELQSRIRRALETRTLRHEVSVLQEAVRSDHGVGAMVTESSAMKAVVDRIRALADTDATVMILGESGTGKELVARALHVDGRRCGRPFVAVNCGAFVETLLESELFGHEKGAFTGAVSLRKGAFERADGGTLFLDEIGDAPLPVQVKLLRVIEEREIIRVGGQTSIPVDVRIISATNRDIEEMVAEGAFRNDLLYRLKVVDIDIPPLRARREDIRPLAERFIANACREYGRRIERVDPACYGRLEDYAWPGNVRELRNAVESAVVMTRGPELLPDAFNLDLRSTPSVQRSWDVPAGMRMADIERDILMQVLSRHRGNRTLAAEELGLSRRTVQRKIKDYDLPF
jgi:DNA-binding NtrC family response regulator